MIIHLVKKTQLVYIIALLILSCNSEGISEDKIPSVVLNTLEVNYPMPKKVTWKRFGSLYEAEFGTSENAAISVRIDEAGRLIMHKQAIAGDELASGIIATIENQYHGYTISDAEKIERDNVVYYQVELKSMGKKEVNLVFSPNGNQEKTANYWD
jgi:biopolymer transport protein ExbD